MKKIEIISATPELLKSPFSGSIMKRAIEKGIVQIKFHDLKEYSVNNNKIILLDFTGWACANCRRMEENVWSKPAIFELLDNNFVIVSLYVDDRTDLSEDDKFKFINQAGKIQYISNVGRRWSLFQQINFKNASQPYYVAMLPSGKILTEPIQFTSEQNFKNWLELAITESNK